MRNYLCWSKIIPLRCLTESVQEATVDLNLVKVILLWLRSQMHNAIQWTPWTYLYFTFIIIIMVIALILLHHLLPQANIEDEYSSRHSQEQSRSIGKRKPKEVLLQHRISMTKHRFRRPRQQSGDIVSEYAMVLIIFFFFLFGLHRPLHRRNSPTSLGDGRNAPVKPHQNGQPLTTGN